VVKGYRQTGINDLVLIYQGGTHRLDWTQEDFEPYVVHEDAQGNRNWFFDGFLFLEFKDGKGRCFASRYEKLGARKTEWIWLMDRIFEKERALSALNATIQQQIDVLGAPPHKHQVVLGLPEPIPDQKDWGQIEGSALDFSNEKDKFSACRWYIDEISARFKSADFKNLELAGFYWISEDIVTSKALTIPIGDYIRQQNRQFYWIPYWSATGFSDWKALGFDVAYLQPNHFFTPKIPDQRLDDACQLAHTNHMGMEVEFDADALADQKNSSRERLVAYLDHFEKNGVFDQSAIAYYEGGGAIIRFAKSKNPDDKALMDRLANLVQQRQNLRPLNTPDLWNDTNQTTDIDPVTNHWLIRAGTLNTRGKFDTNSGEIKAKIRIPAQCQSDKITIRLTPAALEKDTPRVNDEITLMHYSGARPGFIEGGIKTAAYNETTGVEKKASLQLFPSAAREFTLTCRWDSCSIRLWSDNALFFALDNYNLNRAYANFPDYWPFDDPFCLEIVAESEHKDPVLEIITLSFKNLP
jgi:hypothetical protein